MTLVPLQPARPALDSSIRSARRLSIASAAVGIALTLCIAVPLVAFIAMVSAASARSTDYPSSAYDGLGMFLAWLAGGLVALVLAACLAIAALVLDILLLVRDLELRSSRWGSPVRGALPLLLALIGGTGVVSTPLLLLLCLVPAQILGSGPAMNAVLLVLLGLMIVIPMVCRLLQIAFAHELRS